MNKPGNNVVPIQPVAEEGNPNRLPFSLEEMLAEFDNGQVPRSTYWKAMIRALYETANHVITGIESVAGVKSDEMGNIPLSPYDINIQEINRDTIGRQLFYADACKVVHQQGAHYRIMPGAGYVGGIKFFYPGQEDIEVDNTGKSLWLDVCWANPSSTEGQTIERPVVADQLEDYETPEGVQHFVEKLADFTPDGEVTDRRNRAELNKVFNRNVVQFRNGASFGPYEKDGRMLLPRFRIGAVEYVAVSDITENLTFTSGDVDDRFDGTVAIQTSQGEKIFNRIAAEAVNRGELDAIDYSKVSVTSVDSTVARTLADRFSDTVNVKDYGATGHDDTEQTQYLQAAMYKGGRVIIPPGVYSTEVLEVLDQVESIEGYGAVLVARNPAEHRSILRIASSTQIRILGIHFKSEGIIGNLIQGSGIQIMYTGILLRDCTFEGAGIGVDLDSVENLQVLNCRFLHNKVGGLHAQNAKNSSVSYNTFIGTGGADYMLTAISMQATSGGVCRDNKISFNTIVDTGDSAIFTRAFAGAKLLNIDISHNYIERAGKGAIRFSVPEGNNGALVDGCRAIGNHIKGYGVHVKGGNALSSFRSYSNPDTIVRNIILANNIVDGFDSTGSLPVGQSDYPAPGSMIGYAVNCLIADNIYTNTTGKALQVESSPGVQIKGNIIDNCGAFQDDLKVSASVYIGYCNDVVYSGSIKNSPASGLYIRSCINGHLTGTIEGSKATGLYIEHDGSVRNTGVNFEMNCINNGRDLYFGADDHDAPILKWCEWSGCHDSLGPLDRGDTARRTKYFKGEGNTGKTYVNTETKTLDVYLSSNTWLTVSTVGRWV